jgi:hypothetical protein
LVVILAGGSVVDDLTARGAFAIQGDHFQFYLEDVRSQADTSTIWDDDALTRMLATGPGLLAVRTARYGGAVRVVVEVRATRPEEPLTAWDRVVEASIEVPSGELILSAPEAAGAPDLPRLTVPPGSYRALACYGGLDSVQDEEAKVGADHYRIVLWPGPATRPAVLKG